MLHQTLAVPSCVGLLVLSCCPGSSQGFSFPSLLNVTSSKMPTLTSCSLLFFCNCSVNYTDLLLLCLPSWNVSS